MTRTFVVLAVVLVAAVLPIVFIPRGALAAPNEIVLGQSASFTGADFLVGDAFNNGLLAAFQEVNARGGIFNKTIRLVSYDDAYLPANVPRIAAQLVADPEIVLWVGMTGTQTLSVALPYAVNNSIAILGPLTSSSTFRRGTTPNILNLRAGDDHEAMAMTRLFITELRLRRIAIVFQNDSLGTPPRDLIVAALKSVGGLPDATLHPFNVSRIARENFTAFALAVLARRPQGVVLFGVSTFSNPFLEEMHRAMTFDVAFILPSYNGEPARTHLRSKGIVPRNVYVAQVMPHPMSNTSRLARAFRAAVTARSGAANATFDYVGIEGYAVGRFAVELLRRTPTLRRADLLDAAYATRMFGVEELLLGPFSSDCVHDPGTAEGRSSLCRCNQGMRFAATTRLTAGYEYESAAPDLTYPLTECSSPRSVLAKALVLAYVTKVGDANAAGVAALLQQGARLGTKQRLFFEPVFVGNAVNASLRAVQALGEDTPLIAAVAGAPLPDLALAGFPVFGHFSLPAALTGLTFERSAFHFFAPVEHQLFAITESLARRNVTGVVLCYAASHMADAEARLMSGEDITTVTEDAATASSLTMVKQVAFGNVSFASALADAANAATGAKAAVIVAGISTPADVDAVFAELVAKPTLTVCLIFNEAAFLWRSFTAARPNVTAEVTRRIILSSNLPVWTSSRGGALAASYALAAAGLTREEQQHPFMFVGYVLGRIIQSTIERTFGDTTPSVLTTSFYDRATVNIDELALGQFSDRDCPTTTTGGGGGGQGFGFAQQQTCRCAIGTRQVRVFTLDAMASGGSVISTERNRGCRWGSGMNNNNNNFNRFRFTSAPAPDNTVVVSASSSAVVIVVLGVAAVAVYVVVTRARRNNSAAPRDQSVPFTILFTDVESSTTLWGMYPDEMTTAMDTHHALIRKLISKHGVYEVKTIGDSFMVASKSPDAALRFALDLQTTFYEFDWGTHLIDDAYRQTTGVAERRRAGIRTFQPSASMSNDARTVSDRMTMDGYRGAWNGLRVRIGIHHGLGEIREDPVTKGIDYYGNVVNVASRVESAGHGGQIVVTKEFFEAVSTGMPDITYSSAMTTLGAHRLRGAVESEVLAQILPAALSDRTFPPLRTDTDVAATTESATVSGSAQKSKSESDDGSLTDLRDDLATKHSLFGGGGGSSGATLSSVIQRNAEVIEDLLQPMTAKRRLEVVTPLLKAWRVRLPTKADGEQWKTALLWLGFRTTEMPHTLKYLNEVFDAAEVTRICDVSGSGAESTSTTTPRRQITRDLISFAPI